MKIKKIIAAVAATALAVSVMAFSASAQTFGTINISMADEAWATQYWGGELDAEGNTEIKSATNAEITGDGTYTASIEFNAPISGMTFIAICSDIVTDTYPDMNVVIDSVKVNGSEIPVGAVNGAPLWKDDAGKMRVNIYNGWSTETTDWATELTDYVNAESIDVTFTVTGTGATTAETTPVADTTTTSTGTGNTTAGVIAAVMVVSVAGVVATRKRK